jgi:uncharacterized protein
MPTNDSDSGSLQENTTDSNKKSGGRRGFAGMDPAQVRELASKGGKAAHRKGTAHEFSPEEAREAGRKGGLAAHGPREPKAAQSSS